MSSTNDFVNVPETNCCITLDGDGEQPSLEQVETLIKLRDDRDELDKKWRRTLLKNWDAARQRKTGNVDDDIERLEREATTPSAEIQIKRDQCKAFCDQLQKDKIKLCHLAKCFWHPKLPVQVSCSVFHPPDKNKATGPHETYIEGITVGYLENNFKRLDQAHRVPSVLIMPDEYNQAVKRGSDNSKKTGGKIKKLSYYSDSRLEHHDRLSGDAVEDITSKRRGDYAVELLVEKLMSCEGDLPGGMFVISNLKHQNYLSEIRTKEKLVTAQDGDHDVTVIHRNLGVIFFQVKGCLSNSRTKTQHKAVLLAVEQIIKDKLVFYESNRDLEFVQKGLPVYGFAALPNLQSSDLKGLDICDGHFRNILTGSDLSDLSGWLKDRVTADRPDQREVMNENEYKLICGRYVGLATAVSLRTYNEGVMKVGQMMKVIHLTPRQLDLVKNNHGQYVFLTGDYGTGKSLVLVQKAQKLVEEDDNCVAFVISCSDIDNYQFCKCDRPYRSADQLKRFLKTDTTRIKVLQFRDILLREYSPEEGGKRRVSCEEFYNFILKYTSDTVGGERDVKTHIFLDEVLTALLLKEGTNTLEACGIWENIGSDLPEGSYCWISVSTHSYVMSRDYRPDRLVPIMPSMFEWHYLPFIMRVTGHVCNLVKGIEAHTGNGFFEESSIGHTFMGPKPLLSTLAVCECDEPGDLPCNCSHTRLHNCLEKVKEIFNFVNDDLTIIIFFFHCEEFLLPLYRQFQTVMQETFSKFHVKLKWNTMYGSQIPQEEGGEGASGGQRVISVVDQHTFIGCESQNVMCIDMFGMHQWFSNDSTSEWFTFIVSRCTSQYIHINWPEEEAKEQWLKFLDGYEAYCKASSINAPYVINITDMIKMARDSPGRCVSLIKEKQLMREVN
ncbi:uncharacterized protein [Apostichopus japonicus]|uniref:uncharacterized protein n=1 Tax=Stichopus japonicus TaxID=307972 RepID=UPI003AB747A3